MSEWSKTWTGYDSVDYWKSLWSWPGTLGLWESLAFLQQVFTWDLESYESDSCFWISSLSCRWQSAVHRNTIKIVQDTWVGSVTTPAVIWRTVEAELILSSFLMFPANRDYPREVRLISARWVQCYWTWLPLAEQRGVTNDWSGRYSSGI